MSQHTSVNQLALNAALAELLEALVSLANELRMLEADGTLDTLDAQGYDSRACVEQARASIRKGKGK